MAASSRRNTVSKQTVPDSQKDTRTLKRREKKVLASLADRLTWPGAISFQLLSEGTI